MLFLSGEYKGLKYNKSLAVESAKFLQKHYFPNDFFVSGIFSFSTEYEELEYEKSMSNCLELLSKCDGVVFLSNYLNSVGAKIERDFVKDKQYIRKYYFDYIERVLYKMHDNGNLELIKPSISI